MALLSHSIKVTLTNVHFGDTVLSERQRERGGLQLPVQVNVLLSLIRNTVPAVCDFLSFFFFLKKNISNTWKFLFLLIASSPPTHFSGP